MGILKSFIDDTSAFALFLCRTHGYTSMAGRAGASQDAPVSMRPVMPTPSGSATREIGISGGGNKHYSSEVALWLQSSPLTAIYAICCPFPSTPPRISPSLPTTAPASPKP
ncbi:ash family protein [Escherichia sp. 94.0001]|nr:ash family protein [Escherichia sp. 94.0001]